MCMPLPAAAPGAGATSKDAFIGQGSTAFFGAIGEFGAAKNKVDQENAVRKINIQNALASAVENYNAVNLRVAQQREAASAELRSISRQSLQLLGQGRASGAASGTAGASVEALIRDFEKKEGDSASSVLRSLSFSEEQAERQKRGVSLNLEAIRFNNRKRKGPSLLAAILKGATGVGESFIDNTFIDDSGTRVFGQLPKE